MSRFTFTIKIDLPEDIDHSKMSKEVDKFFTNTVMKIQREFVEARSVPELELLYLAQKAKDSPFSALVKKELIKEYKLELSDAKKELVTIGQFILSFLSMVDTKQELSTIKNEILIQHFKGKKLESLADLYHDLFDEGGFDERPELVIDLMTGIIIEKLDGTTSIETLNKFLSADAQNDKLENFVQEKFRIIRK